MPRCLSCEKVIGDGTVIYDHFPMCPECQIEESMRWAHCRWDILWAEGGWEYTPLPNWAAGECTACGHDIIDGDAFSKDNLMIHYTKHRCHESELKQRVKETG